MEELIGFGMKNSLNLPTLANKYFNNLKDENDQPINTFNDGFMKQFVRQSIRGSRCLASYQYYTSNISDKVLKIISKELDNNVTYVRF